MKRYRAKLEKLERALVAARPERLFIGYTETGLYRESLPGERGNVDYRFGLNGEGLPGPEYTLAELQELERQGENIGYIHIEYVDGEAWRSIL